MINNDTIFILGAGASQPFGYPTGLELRNRICSNSNNKELASILASVDEDLADYESFVIKFRETFLKSGTLSIDTFLEHNQEFMEIGKMAIAQELIPCEVEKSLFDTKDNWYMYLLKHLITNFNDFGKNQVSFITFNYDRSLEHFLFTSLKNLYRKTDDECAVRLGEIPIIHLYGQFDLLPWQGEGLSYQTKYNVKQRLRNAKNNIQLISQADNVEQNPNFQKAYKLMCSAKIVYFLGFGYDKINLDRLQILSYLNSQQLDIAGSAFGLAQAERDSIGSYFGNRIKLGISHAKVNDFLREYVVFE